MRIFIAGASGVIGRNVVPLLVEAGHTVTGMTRSPAKADDLVALGALPVVCDVYDLDALTDAVVGCAPECVIHQLTDLPDDPAQIAAFSAANGRIRTEGTRNLIAATTAAGASRLLAQSIAWTPSAGVELRDTLEALVLDFGGVVLRYGQLYGPGTYYPDAPPDHPRIEIGSAARRTVEQLDAPSGIELLVE